MLKSTDLPLSARLLRAYLATSWRGRTRLAAWAARIMPPLWSVPLPVHNTQLFVDLRIDSFHPWLVDTRTGASPIEMRERSLMDAFVSPGMIAYDIGAHVGLFVTYLAQRVGNQGHVHAFEPQPAILKVLRRTVGGLPNVILHEVVLSDTPGRAQMYIPLDTSMASLSGYAGGDSIWCAARRLNDLARDDELRHPQFVKVDVEGSESKVFAGASEILNRSDAPIVYFEAVKITAEASGFSVDAGLRTLERMEHAMFRFYRLRREHEPEHIPLLRPHHEHDWIHGQMLLAVPVANRSAVATAERLCRDRS